MVKDTTSQYGTGLGIAHEDRTNLVGDGTKGFEVDQSRVCGRAADDHLGLVLTREGPHFVIVDEVGVLTNAVRHDREPFAGEIDLGSVRQVTTVREIHRQHSVAGHDERAVHRDVGARP